MVDIHVSHRAQSPAQIVWEILPLQLLRSLIGMEEKTEMDHKHHKTEGFTVTNFYFNMLIMIRANANLPRLPRDVKMPKVFGDAPGPNARMAVD